jgi:hypothetical protein
MQVVSYLRNFLYAILMTFLVVIGLGLVEYQKSNSLKGDIVETEGKIIRTGKRLSYMIFSVLRDILGIKEDLSSEHEKALIKSPATLFAFHRLVRIRKSIECQFQANYPSVKQNELAKYVLDNPQLILRAALQFLNNDSACALNAVPIYSKDEKKDRLIAVLRKAIQAEAEALNLLGFDIGSVYKIIDLVEEMVKRGQFACCIEEEQGISYPDIVHYKMRMRTKTAGNQYDWLIVHKHNACMMCFSSAKILPSLNITPEQFTKSYGSECSEVSDFNAWLDDKDCVRPYQRFTFEVKKPSETPTALVVEDMHQPKIVAFTIKFPMLATGLEVIGPRILESFAAVDLIKLKVAVKPALGITHISSEEKDIKLVKDGYSGFNPFEDSIISECISDGDGLMTVAKWFISPVFTAVEKDSDSTASDDKISIKKLEEKSKGEQYNLLLFRPNYVDKYREELLTVSTIFEAHPEYLERIVMKKDSVQPVTHFFGHVKAKDKKSEIRTLITHITRCLVHPSCASQWVTVYQLTEQELQSIRLQLLKPF